MKGLLLNGFTDRIGAFGLGVTAMFGTAIFGTAILGTAIFGTAIFDKVLTTAALAQEPACPPLPPDRPGFNSTFRRTPNGLTQVIGRQSDQHYGVIVPEAYSLAVLAQVQICIPDAFWVESRFGPYIQSGFLYRRVEAEALSKALESQRINARVVYYP